MQKKMLSFLFIFTLVISLCSCQREERIDFSELILRINKSDKTVSLEREDAFFSDSQWFLYASVLYENDHLIVAAQDESMKLIRVRISVLNTGEEGKDEAFRRLCTEAGKAFVSEKINSEQLLKDAGLYDGELFRNGSGFAEIGRYKVSAFYSDVGSSVEISIK